LLTPRKPFADLASGFGQNDLQSKMVLLTLAFPKVKFIWSSSPYETAEIFEELKVALHLLVSPPPKILTICRETMRSQIPLKHLK
jgi:ERCC4-type nuclease